MVEGINWYCPKNLDKYTAEKKTTYVVCEYCIKDAKESRFSYRKYTRLQKRRNQFNKNYFCAKFLNT